VGSHLIKSLAYKLDVDVIDGLKERKDKLVSKLFMKKLEFMLEDKPKNLMFRCVKCNKLLAARNFRNLDCPYAKPRIDGRGRLRANHLLERDWEIKKFINFVRETYRISWREIFWKVWSYLVSFKCRTCNRYFTIGELNQCARHSEKPKFDKSPNEGL
jgi:uncharacterized CHY-type Zn-finger protein